MGPAMGLAQQFPSTHLRTDKAQVGFREKCVNTQLKVKQQAERFTQPETKRETKVPTVYAHQLYCPLALPAVHYHPPASLEPRSHCAHKAGWGIECNTGVPKPG